MSTHALYRFFDDSGTLLYVGITLDPGRRWKRHANEKDWWTEKVRIEVEPHPTREAALKAERAAIKAERPRNNIQHMRLMPRVEPSCCRTGSCTVTAVGECLGGPHHHCFGQPGHYEYEEAFGCGGECPANGHCRPSHMCICGVVISAYHHPPLGTDSLGA